VGVLGCCRLRTVDDLCERNSFEGFCSVFVGAMDVDDERPVIPMELMVRFVFRFLFVCFLKFD
jgi:hypothetical protein